jgi:uncharacterized protein (TIGR03067 family)
MLGDLDLLQGRWQIVALEVDGREVSKDSFADARIIIDGDDYATAGMGASYSGKILLDQTSHPKKFDLNFSDGPHGGKASLEDISVLSIFVRPLKADTLWRP